VGWWCWQSEVAKHSRNLWVISKDNIMVISNENVPCWNMGEVHPCNIPLLKTNMSGRFGGV